MSFNELLTEVDSGLKGLNRGFPTGHERAAKSITIRKNQYMVIGGSTGSGKSSYLDDMLVLNPVEHFLKNRDGNSRLKILYNSMERSKKYKLARWVCRRIFLDHGIKISVGRLFGWFGTITKDEHDLFLMYQDYLGEVEEIVEIYEGSENPVGLAKRVHDYALRNGKVEEVGEYKKVYIPNDPNLVTQIIGDHVGLTKTTKDCPTKKQAIDRVSADNVHFRDFYGFSPTIVQQYNRNLGDGSKGKDITPQLSDFAETSQTTHDADLVLALFDPIRFKLDESDGYKPGKFRDLEGGKRFRSLRILKASMGPDDLVVGMAFQPSLGIFKELPKSKDVTEDTYKRVINDQYFRYGV